MIRLSVVLLFCTLFSTRTGAQQKIYTQKEVDSTPIYPTNRENIREFRRMLMTDTNLLGWPYYYSKLSALHLRENTLDSCYYYANKSIQSYQDARIKREKDEKYLARAYYNGGRALRIYYRNYHKSLDYLMNALHTINKYPRASKYLKGYILKEISTNHTLMGADTKALEYLIKTTKDTNYLKNPLNYSPLYNTIGKMYEGLNKQDSAKYYFNIALLDTIKERKVTTHNHLGNLFYATNQKDSAIYHFKKSKEIMDLNIKKVADYSRYMSQTNYGYVLLDMKKYDSSISLLNKVLDSINGLEKFEKPDKYLKVKNMNYLIKAYRKTGALDKALSVAEEKSDFLEAFHKQILDEKLRDLTIAYEVKEKDESINELQATTKEQSTIIRQQNIIGIILGVVLLAIIAIGILIFRQRKLQTKYETANLEQRLLRSQLNPHFVFNALNTASSLASKNSKNTTAYITKLASLIRLILQNSREEFVSLEDELKSIEDYLELQSNFSQKFNYKINIEHTVDQEETYIPPMFIQPFIENSIEHGLRGINDGLIEIEMGFDNSKNLIKCKIKDNGIGLANSSKQQNDSKIQYESLSGKILKERLDIYAKSMNKNTGYTINDIIEGNGTEVIVSLPYIEE